MLIKTMYERKDALSRFEKTGWRVYLDNNRRVTLYLAGGMNQERRIIMEGGHTLWLLANDESWIEVQD